MSEEPEDSRPASRTRTVLGDDRPPESSALSARAFLDQHLGLLLALSLGTGLGCGALAAFVNGLNPEGPAFLEWSVGLYVTPPLLLGWAAVRAVPATVAGAIAYLTAVLGHLATTALSMDDYNMPEYRAWFLVGLILGAFLGYLGWLIRSHSTGVRAFGAGFPLGLMALFLWMNIRAQADTGERSLHPAALLLEGSLALFLLALCRGWTARGTALLYAVALVIPFVFVLIPVFLLVWYASGDY